MLRLAAPGIGELSTSGRGFDLGFDAGASLLPRRFKIVVGLQSHPELGRSSEEPAQPQRGVGRYRLVAADDLLHLLRGNPQLESRGLWGNSPRL